MNTANHLKLHGLIERDGDVYAAHCIELGIAVQGDSVKQVKAMMDEAIGDYISRVVEIYKEGDVESAKALLTRKAPLSIRCKFHVLKFINYFRNRNRSLENNVWEEDRPSPLAFS